MRSIGLLAPVHLGDFVLAVAPPPAAPVTRSEATAPAPTQEDVATDDASARHVEAAVIEAPWAHAPVVRARVERWRAMHVVTTAEDQPEHQHTVRGDVAGARAELQVRSTRAEDGALRGGVRLSVAGRQHHVHVSLSPEALRVLERELISLRRALVSDHRRRSAQPPAAGGSAT